LEALSVQSLRERAAIRPGTLILETTFKTDQGSVRVIDFMPPKTDLSKVIRLVEGIEGKVEMRSELSRQARASS
jgi:hypothetical protein